MKILAIGDTHGRNIVIDIMRQYILDDTIDKIVLIGDYFDSFDIGGQQQIDNFKTIIDFKIAFPDKVIILIGNHDCHYMSFWQERYSGFQHGWQYSISHLLHTNLEIMQMCYIVDNIVFTHAGVTKTWCTRILGNGDLIPSVLLETAINDQWHHVPFKSFGFHGRDYSGDDVTQGPVWVRPNSLIDDAIPGIHIVGHTQQSNGISRSKTDDGKVYFIDCLNYKRQYLLIDTDDQSYTAIDI